MVAHLLARGVHRALQPGAQLLAQLADWFGATLDVADLEELVEFGGEGDFDGEIPVTAVHPVGQEAGDQVVVDLATVAQYRDAPLVVLVDLKVADVLAVRIGVAAGAFPWPELLWHQGEDDVDGMSLDSQVALVNDPAARNRLFSFVALRAPGVVPEKQRVVEGDH